MTFHPIICVLFLFVMVPVSAFGDAAGDAELLFQSAQDRWEADDNDGALEALEKAYHLNPDARFMYLRLLVLERMGEVTLALQVLEEHRQKLIEHPDVVDVALVEERLRSADQVVPAAENSDRSDGSFWGPVALGVGGAALLGVAGYGLFGASCSITSTDDGCLVGTEAQFLPVTLYGGGGLIAISTALLWACFDQPDDEPGVRLEVGVQGLDVWVHGSF